MDSPKERQENELQALKSIFNDELIDMRECKNPPWLNLVITLGPLKDSTGSFEVHAQVNLHIICSDEYPDREPEIQIENIKGLSVQQVDTLKTELKKLAVSLQGEVMIFDLAQYVQKFLHENNKPSSKSFYEEMLKRRMEKEQDENEKKKLRENKQRQALQEEIERKQKVLQEERIRKEEIDKNMNSCSNADLLTDDKNKFQFSRPQVQCEHRGTKFIQFLNNVKIHRGKCLGHSSTGSVVYVGLDTASGDFLAVKEWIFKIKPKTANKEYISKQLTSIEQEFMYIQKLKHENLIHYVDFKYSLEKEDIIVYLLQEFVVGSNLKLFLKKDLCLDADIVRHFVTGVLKALYYLHQNNIVHRNVKSSNIYIDETGTVRLSNFSINKRVTDLFLYSNQEGTSSSSDEKSTRKTDVFQMGVTFLNLMKGSHSNLVYFEVPELLSSEVRDFLVKCLIKDESKRWSVKQLLEHPFVKPPLEKELSPSLIRTELEKEFETTQQGLKSEVNLNPYFVASDLKGQSRICSEFETLQFLGRGAFGDVLKVKNKLDGGIYALKRIELNPKNKQLNRKITREVQLLSQLNHENVVRYYNSWIESATVSDEGEKSSTDTVSTSLNQVKEIKSLVSADNIEALAPPLKDVEWNISYESKSRAGAILCDEADGDSDSSDDSSEEWIPVRRRRRSASSDSIVFENDDAQEDESTKSVQTPSSNIIQSSGKSSGKGEPSVSSESAPVSKELLFMYIQMEFCEKSTLRNAIDSDIYKDVKRVRRLFREIVEGLAHIHQQGMIHRDLKPVNIFLDSNDHVKIGDFGLATTNIINRPSNYLFVKEHTLGEASADFLVQDPGGDSHTGQVGTSLYVAPELNYNSAKTCYNQKVDIYSLGIIFFEMCYRPLETAMERIKIINNLRSSDISVPTDFAEEHLKIVKWLLKHDPIQRPTSNELLQSGYLPPPQIEEAKLHEMVRHTLSNPQSKGYKYLVSSCFEQNISPAEDITYHMHVQTTASSKSHLLLELAREVSVGIFRKHGAVYMSTPLLTPKSNFYDRIETCVSMMTHSGSIVTVPHDLRVPFARYIAWNGISNLRRYVIDRVYRERKVFGFHPRELYECAFDIISPNAGSLVTDAEVLCVVCEIFNEFPALKNRDCIIKMNHTSILKAILHHCGVESEKHADIFQILNNTRDERTSKLEYELSNILSSEQASIFCNLIQTEDSLNKVSCLITNITKRKSEAANLVKEGIKDLRVIIGNAEAFGIKVPIVVCPGLAYNVQHSSGMIFQYVCRLKQKRRRAFDVIAAGCRYDSLLAKFRQISEMCNVPKDVANQSAVGMSISLEKIVSVLLEENSDLSPVDVVVCSFGQNSMIKEKISVLKDLWNAGIKCQILDDMETLEDIQNYCIEASICHIALLKDSESGTVRIRSWEREREKFQEKKLKLSDVVDFLQKSVKVNAEGSDILSSSRQDNCRVSVSESSSVVSSGNPPLNIHIVTIDGTKMPASSRRRYENQIKSHLSGFTGKFSSQTSIEVIGALLESSVIKALAFSLELDYEQKEFKSNVEMIAEKYPRHKKYITKICDKVVDLINAKSNLVIIVYSIKDDSFKLLV